MGVIVGRVQEHSMLVTMNGMTGQQVEQFMNSSKFTDLSLPDKLGRSRGGSCFGSQDKDSVTSKLSETDLTNDASPHRQGAHQTNSPWSSAVKVHFCIYYPKL
jgi:hypothetical protein